MFTSDDIKLVSLKKRLTWKFKCPLCGQWLYITDEEFTGKQTIECSTQGCPFDELHDLSELLDKVNYALD